MNSKRIMGVFCILVAVGALLGGVIVILDKESGSNSEIVDTPQVRENTGTVIPELVDGPDWAEVTDLNEDGKYNVLDLIIYIQEGE